PGHCQSELCPAQPEPRVRRCSGQQLWPCRAALVRVRRNHQSVCRWGVRGGCGDGRGRAGCRAWGAPGNM
ncbi:hypothetical protein EC988_006441, partial [Linderina pennispora]